MNVYGSSALSRCRTPVLDRLAEWQASCRGVARPASGSSRASNLHVTVAFLGSPPRHGRRGRSRAELAQRPHRRGADPPPASALPRDAQRRHGRARRRGRARRAVRARRLPAARADRRVRARAPPLASARHGAPVPPRTAPAAGACPTSARSVRPGRLSTIRCFAPVGRSTRLSNRLH